MGFWMLKDEGVFFFIYFFLTLNLFLWTLGLVVWSAFGLLVFFGCLFAG